MTSDENSRRHSGALEHVGVPMQTLADRFEVVSQLGRGSFGQTLLARDLQHDRLVAVKLFDPRGATDWKSQELFDREATVLGALRHHGVPEIHDHMRIEQDGSTVALLVMEYIEGKSIEQMIEEHRALDGDEVMHLVLELLGILDYLHGRVPPILHRDIKPSNIIVRPSGMPVLVDFGSVRRVFLREDESGSTIAGTYGYMPYEQYMGQAGPSSDLYSLAATMLHLITGRAPRDFIGDDGAIEVPSAIPGDERLAGTLRRMLRRSPAERFASARDVRQELLRTTTAIVATDTRASRIQLSNQSALLPELIPRVIEGEVAKLLDAAAPGVFDIMDTTTRASDRSRVASSFLLTLYSLVTFGILPLLYLGSVSKRRNRLRRFLTHGIETTAEVTFITTETASTGEKMSKVGYQFFVDGELRRDADRILPTIAQRWAPGDNIRVLYIPESDDDSVIISTR